MKALNYLVEVALTIEKARVAQEVGLTHNRKKGRVDPERIALHKRIRELEDYVDGRVAALINTHPAYHWFSQVKGIGKENIGKVVALCRVAPEKGEAPFCNSCGERLLWSKESCECGGKPEIKEIDLAYADTISALWKFAGYAPVDGHAMKRVKGEKLQYNSQLRTMCWRVGSSLLRARGKFYEYYIAEKDKFVQRLTSEGKVIVPGNKLPLKDGKRTEDATHFAEGHVHLYAMRKMIKLFLSCLWLEWRSGLGLPVREPYVIGELGHTSVIKPEDMTDR